MIRIVFSLIFALSAFGQSKGQFFEDAVASGKTLAIELEKFTPERNKALADLSAALDTRKPTEIKEAFYKVWHLELDMNTLVARGKSDAKYIRQTAESALEYKWVSEEQVAEGIKIVPRLETLVKAGESKPEHLALHTRMLAFFFGESEQVIKRLERAADDRKKVAKRLEKELARNNGVEINITANQFKTVYVDGVIASRDARAISSVLGRAETEWESGHFTDDQYRKSQQLVSKLDIAYKMRWALDDQLALYRQAQGVAAVTELIMMR